MSLRNFYNILPEEAEAKFKNYHFINKLDFEIAFSNVLQIRHHS